MPAIAASVRQRGASFYWHLGDFRALYNFDEDIQHEPEHIAKPLSISDYQQIAWDDFLQNQIAPFSPVPVFLGIGNHETIPPHSRELYLIHFADWLDAPKLRDQRLRDDPHAYRLNAYYHWIDRGVDFINLDNSTEDQFDDGQVAWFEKVLQADSADPAILSIVVGMHKALPDSFSKGHSMNESPTGTESGRRVYGDLLKAQNESHKHIYVLASHSHYFLDGIFNTDFWRANGGVIPGWIVGTAGAVRYKLPEDHSGTRAAETNVYGFLLGSVKPGGPIDFAFQNLRESDVPSTVVDRFSPAFVHWCFAENSVAH